MSKRKASLTAALALLALAAFLPTPALAAPTPVWKLSVASEPTNLVPGSKGENEYLVIATNVGSKATTGEITIADTVAPGLVPVGAFATTNDQSAGDFTCAIAAPTVTCKSPGPIKPGFTAYLEVFLDVTASEGAVLANEAEISGGGALLTQASTQTTVSATPALFGFLPGEEGFKAPILDEEGLPVTEAGSHQAHEAVTELGLPTEKPGGVFLVGTGPVRDVTVDFPPGMLANPAATPVRCTEAQLTGTGCPDAAQVGTVVATTFAIAALGPKTSPLYNMVPPPGAPASFGFNALGVGIFPHVIASIRTDTDFGASGFSKDILARGQNPVLGVSVELWGDPSAKAHDAARGTCLFDGGKTACPVPAQKDTFLAMPVSCPEAPLSYRALADGWKEEGLFREAFYESAELDGDPVEIEGCNELDFKPELTLRPTTNLTESPTGLEVDLFQPQDFTLAGRSTAALKDITVTLPPGLEVNAAQADGLAACTPAQAGMLSGVGESPASFAARPTGCPDAAKIGKVEVTTPLLAQYDEEGKVERDPETGEVIPEPLFGSLYVAEPFQNPFNSLLAIYLTVQDPQTGTFATLAGEAIPNPATGQLTTRFVENPQLPLEHARIELFKGNRASLQTPPTCATHTTVAQLTPWSAPQTPSVPLTDSFATTAAPGGGPCPATATALPHAPSFRAGTLSPIAGAFSPLVAKLSRADATQRMARLETVLPTGLSAKLAGVQQCSEAQIALASSRSQPNQGALELTSPSCPPGSELGRAVVGAGAGPTPLYITGRIYLAGPYKGAPLSIVVITPAIAGPFDLGVVVVRAALHLDPTTAQARAVSDPFPQILHGIPVDVRSVSVEVSRPNFSLNPTSCDPKSFGGSVTSTLGAVAPLSDHFQVGGCDALPYKPKLNIRLFGPTTRGGHPRFRAIFTARPGDANTARISLTLPRSEFIDQSHFRTICTRVQFAANQCPPGSIYGHVKATSPLVDYPLEGPTFLRSSDNELPDAVAALRGPPHQPLAIDGVARIDSVKGALRAIVDTVPDAPLTKVIITQFGAKKGLFQNSTNICKGIHRATAKLTAQNGRKITLRPKMQASCKGRSGRNAGGGKGKGAKKGKGGR